MKKNVDDKKECFIHFNTERKLGLSLKKKLLNLFYQNKIVKNAKHKLIVFFFIFFLETPIVTILGFLSMAI